MKDVKNYESYYSVDENGNVYSKERVIVRHIRLKNGVYVNQNVKVRAKKLTPYKAKTGYYVVNLCDNGHNQRYIHHLVAEAFLGERPTGYTINHKDGNKLNNHVTNLEYCTYAENNRHAVETGLNKHKVSDYSFKRPVAKIDPKTMNVLNVYESCAEAEHQNNVCHVGCAASGKRKTAGGFKWRYI